MITVTRLMDCCTGFCFMSVWEREHQNVWIGGALIQNIKGVWRNLLFVKCNLSQSDSPLPVEPVGSRARLPTGATANTSAVVSRDAVLN